MKTILKYKVIKTREQYDEYCSILDLLLENDSEDTAIEDEIDLLTTLIEAYDRENTAFKELDPVELLRSFMDERNMKAIELSHYLESSRGNVSDILNYKKSISKKLIRKLAALFKVTQEAFNRPYKLSSSNQVKAKSLKPKKKLAVSR